MTRPTSTERKHALRQRDQSGRQSRRRIHLHHQRQDPREFPINFAEGLPLYFRDHDGPAMPTGGVAEVDDTFVPLGPTLQHVGP